MTSVSNFELRHFILCDDIRQETAGKVTLVGVYSDDVIFSVFPAGINKLVFRISVKLLKDDSKKFFVKTTDEEGKDVFKFDGELLKQTAGEIANIHISILMMQFQKPNKYKIFFSLDDEPPEQIGEFLTRPPKNEQERQQMLAVNPKISIQVPTEKPSKIN
jgi:hypothetical protein